MRKKLLLFLVLIICTVFSYSQEINTDDLYLQALQEYREGNYEQSLKLTETALKVAPEYHDIRILKIRNLFALQNYEQTDIDIDQLLSTAPNYEDVRKIAFQRLQQLPAQEALTYSSRLLEVYPNDTEVRIHRARLLLEAQRAEEAREQIAAIYSSEDLTNGQRYVLQQLINFSVKNAIQVTGQYLNFSDDYPRNDSWYAISAEYQRNFKNLALIGRATYSDRSYSDGSLYEIEAYPVFSEKFYAFTNFGISNGEIFPDYRASASVFYNFAGAFEAEAGFRSLFYNDNSYLTAIAGLSAYTGRFYLNARAFAGPERLDKLVQNYQFNVRYYLSTPENYIFGRIGSGISPDDPVNYTRAQENPTLEALCLNLGLNKTIGLFHVISLSGGILSEDLAQEKTGTQLNASLGYRFKF